MVKTIKKENIKNGLVEELCNNGQLKRIDKTIVSKYLTIPIP
jgi:hypothetical protein|tara:strand:- start:771 stop:896 length:126 start_codon:yes stop_codon:yes gene_type:complete